MRDRQTQTPTHAIPSVKRSRVFVQCFTADTFSTPWCLYSISGSLCSRKELKLFVRLMRRRRPVQFTSHQRVFIRVWRVERAAYITLFTGIWTVANSLWERLIFSFRNISLIEHQTFNYSYIWFEITLRKKLRICAVFLPFCSGCWNCVTWKQR